MDCFECMYIIPILIFRLIVYICPCIFKHKPHFKSSLEAQMHSATFKRKFGWWTGASKREINTRECFYTLLGLLDRKMGLEELANFVNKLSENMNRTGQVPARWTAGWWGREIPHFRSRIKEVPVVDSNMFFLILVWHNYWDNPRVITQLYLSTQRAFKWLERFIAEDTFYEPVDSSWETTREHSGHLLLTNVLMIKAIQSMEMIAVVNQDQRTKDKCIALHKKFIQKWQPELYRTQEVLPRILAVYWNILPESFTMSFNQELNTLFIPLRTEGPIKIRKTTRAWLRGRDDMHTDIIWPFVGFLWIIALKKHMKREAASHWWDNYMDFHEPSTLHNMYDLDGKPIRRAFLRSEGMHVATISLFLAAKQAIEDIDKDVTDVPV